MNVFENESKEKQKWERVKKYIPAYVRGHLIFIFDTYVIFIPAFIEGKKT